MSRSRYLTQLRRSNRRKWDVGSVDKRRERRIRRRYARKAVRFYAMAAGDIRSITFGPCYVSVGFIPREWA